MNLVKLDKFLSSFQKIWNWMIAVVGVFVLVFGILISIGFACDPDWVPFPPLDLWGYGICFGAYIGMALYWVFQRLTRD